MAVRVITDSTTYLPNEIKERLNIGVISLQIIDGGVSAAEVDIDFHAYYDRLRDTKILPTSAQPSPEEFKALMLERVEKGDDVVGVFISSEMSGTFETAEMLSEMIRDEHPGANLAMVDSRSNSMQEGFAVMSAAEAAAEGRSMSECVEAAKRTIARTRFLFAPQSLEYLRRGGRIGKASALLGSLLNIVPVLTVEDAVTTTYVKVRTHARAMEAMRDKMLADIEAAGGLRRICVHSIVNLDVAVDFAKRYIEPFVNLPVEIIELGPVIGTHVGSAVGVVYETLNPMPKLH